MILRWQLPCTVIVKLSKKPSEHREALHHSVGEIEYILPSGFSFVSEPFNLMLSGYCCECPTDTGGEVEVDECRTEHFFAPCAESSTIAKRIQKICLPNTIQVRWLSGFSSKKRTYKRVHTRIEELWVKPTGPVPLQDNRCLTIFELSKNPWARPSWMPRQTSPLGMTWYLAQRFGGFFGL